MRALIVFSRGSGSLALVVLRCLAAAGAEVYLAGQERLPPVRASRHARAYAQCRLRAGGAFRAELVDELDRLCRRWGIDVSMPGDTRSALLLSEVGGSLSSRVFPLPPPEQLAMLDNKASFFEYLDEKGIPTPHTVVYEGGPPPSGGYPWVAKPPDMGFGTGVRRVDSPRELSEHVRSGIRGSRPPLLLQRYVDGADVDLSVLAFRGELLAWCIQEWKEGGGFEFIEDESVLETGRAVVEDLGYSGVAHFDLRVEAGSGRPYMIECNPRFWGTMRAAMLHGVNFPYLGAVRAMGVEWPPGAHACRPGPYLRPARAALAALAPRGAGRPPQESLRGLRQVAGDPLPDFLGSLAGPARRCAKISGIFGFRSRDVVR